MGVNIWHMWCPWKLLTFVSTHILLTFVSNFQLLRTSRTRDNFSSRALTRAEVFSLFKFPSSWFFVYYFNPTIVWVDKKWTIGTRVSWHRAILFIKLKENNGQHISMKQLNCWLCVLWVYIIRNNSSKYEIIRGAVMCLAAKNWWVWVGFRNIMLNNKHTVDWTS